MDCRRRDLIVRADLNIRADLSTRTMVHLEFAPALQRHVPAPPLSIGPGTLREVLTEALSRHPAMRRYVFDDQDAVRRHVAVFVNGELQHDRIGLTLPIGDGDRVYIAQALSGG